MTTRFGRWTTGRAIAVLVLIWLILCKPWFLDHRVVPWDSKDAFYPFARFISQSIRSGQSPFWNPTVYGGYPMASDPQSMMFSPVALGLFLIVDKPSFHWFDTIELLHILIGGVGMLLLSVRMGRSPPASLFAAAVFMFGGSAAARMQHVPMIYAYAYFPFALLALEEMLDSNRMRWAVCCGVLAGVMAAHMNQVAYLLSLVLAGYFLYRAATWGSLPAFVAARWRVSIVAALAAALVLAIPVYLVLQFLPFGNRVNISYSMATTNSMGPLPLLTLVFRNFFGSGRSNTFWGTWDITESLFYIGVLPIILILRYGLCGDALLDRRFRYFTGIGVLSVLYAMGNWTPFYWIAYHVLPGVSHFRRPGDATFVMNVVLALATGFLVDRLQTAKHGRIRRGFLWTGIAAFSLLLAWGLHLAWRQHKLGGMTRDFAVATAFILIALWFWHAVAAAKSQKKREFLILAGIVLVAFDFGVHTVGSYLNAAPDKPFALLTDDTTEHDPVVRFLKSGLEPEAFPDPFRADITLAGGLWDNASMFFGIQSTQGYNPLHYGLYDRVTGTQGGVQYARPFSHLAPSYNSPLLNLLGVKYIVSIKPLHEIDPDADANRFPLVLERTVHIWQNLNVLPRVIASTAIYIEPDLDRAIDTGTMAAVDYRSTVVLSHLPKTLAGIDARPLEATRLPGEGEPRVSLLAYGNTEVSISVESSRDVILELNDLYYFPWRVYVDGHERELLQANYLFRGVHVKSGERRVVFRFEPFSWSAIKSTFRGIPRP